eukprot:823993-Amphidinium_carterae.2
MSLSASKLMVIRDKFGNLALLPLDLPVQLVKCKLPHNHLMIRRNSGGKGRKYSPDTSRAV